MIYTVVRVGVLGLCVKAYGHCPTGGRLDMWSVCCYYVRTLGQVSVSQVVLASVVQLYSKVAEAHHRHLIEINDGLHTHNS